MIGLLGRRSILPLLSGPICLESGSRTKTRSSGRLSVLPTLDQGQNLIFLSPSESAPERLHGEQGVESGGVRESGQRFAVGLERPDVAAGNRTREGLFEPARGRGLRGPRRQIPQRPPALLFRDPGLLPGTRRERNDGNRAAGGQRRRCMVEGFRLRRDPAGPPTDGPDEILADVNGVGGPFDRDERLTPGLDGGAREDPQRMKRSERRARGLERVERRGGQSAAQVKGGPAPEPSGQSAGGWRDGVVGNRKHQDVAAGVRLVQSPRASAADIQGALAGAGRIARDDLTEAPAGRDPGTREGHSGTAGPDEAHGRTEDSPGHQQSLPSAVESKRPAPAIFALN